MPIVAAFVATGTQWRVASVNGGMSPGRLVYIGLDYAGAIAGIAAAGIKITPAIWDGVCVMESAALEVLNGNGG